MADPMPPATQRHAELRSAGSFSFSLNLASENVRVLKQVRFALIVCSMALLVLGVVTARDGVLAGRQLTLEAQRTGELRAQAVSVQAQMEQEGLVLTESSEAGQRAQVTVANTMIAQRLFSWSQLLSDLERVVPWGISLNNLQPQPGARTLMLTGEALTLSRFTAFVIALEESPRFDNVIMSDQKSQANGTVTFSLNVSY